MIPLLLLLVAAQVPAVPGEGTLVSFCKQGRLTACQELHQVDPGKYAAIQAELAKAALQQAALKAAADEGGDNDATEAAESTTASAESSDEPPNCTGQNHHIISRPIAKALEGHETLHGLYEPRDERFKTRAKDKESHCGYQEWHRKVDEEVTKWLKEHDNATPAEFMKMLREIYSRKEMLERFPNGF